MSKPNWLNYSSFTNNTIIAALDIGSSKVSCMQSLTESNGISKVIGLGIIATKGIKAGIITAIFCLFKIKKCQKITCYFLRL